MGRTPWSAWVPLDPFFGQIRSSPKGCPVTLKDQILAAFKKVYDPEMPVNIYELGLIYGVEVDEAGQVAIRMTLTAPNCPVAGSLPAEVERAARAVPGVTGVKLELTFDPLTGWPLRVHSK